VMLLITLLIRPINNDDKDRVRLLASTAALPVSSLAISSNTSIPRTQRSWLLLRLAAGCRGLLPRASWDAWASRHSFCPSAGACSCAECRDVSAAAEQMMAYFAPKVVRGMALLI
jgi:hypothetical protein